VPSLNDGIIIGGAGGAIAGLTVYLVQYLHNKTSFHIESKRIYKWLQENTSNDEGKKFRSTRSIASYNNVTEERTKYLCSMHPKIFLSTGAKENLWSIHDREHERVARGWKEAYEDVHNKPIKQD
jgi:hypothetical protein